MRKKFKKIIQTNYYCEEGCGTSSEMNYEKFKQGKCHAMPKGYDPNNPRPHKRIRNEEEKFGRVGNMIGWLLCKLGFHKWRVYRWTIYPFKIEKYCQRCRIEHIDYGG
jgi:hypothetical protein